MSSSPSSCSPTDLVSSLDLSRKRKRTAFDAGLLDARYGRVGADGSNFVGELRCKPGFVGLD